MVDDRVTLKNLYDIHLKVRALSGDVHAAIDSEFWAASKRVLQNGKSQSPGGGGARTNLLWFFLVLGGLVWGGERLIGSVGFVNGNDRGAESMTKSDKGWEYLRAGDYNAALKQFTAAVKAGDRNLPVVAGLTECYYQLKRDGECLAACDELYLIDHGVPRSEFFRAKVLFRLGKDAEALDHLKVSAALGYRPARALLASKGGV